MDTTSAFRVLFQFFSRFENFKLKLEIRGPRLGQSSEHSQGPGASTRCAELGSPVSVTCPYPAQPPNPLGRAARRSRGSCCCAQP